MIVWQVASAAILLALFAYAVDRIWLGLRLMTRLDDK